MARPNSELIHALRTAADRLATEGNYQWGHMGMCNCGHLARQITGLSRREIHESALLRQGDWEQQARDYCPTSGLLIDFIIAAMMDFGLTRQDIGHLEKLSDPEVLRLLAFSPERNNRDHVVTYLRAWSDLLEENLSTEELLDARENRLDAQKSPGPSRSAQSLKTS